MAAPASLTCDVFVRRTFRAVFAFRLGHVSLSGGVMDVSATKGPLSVRAYRGDAKTLLAFNLTKAGSRNLAGFTIQTTPKGKSPFYIFNSLQFERPADHAQVAAEPARSSINAPI